MDTSQVPVTPGLQLYLPVSSPLGCPETTSLQISGNIETYIQGTLGSNWLATGAVPGSRANDIQVIYQHQWCTSFHGMKYFQEILCITTHPNIDRHFLETFLYFWTYWLTADNLAIITGLRPGPCCLCCPTSQRQLRQIQGHQETGPYLFANCVSGLISFAGSHAVTPPTEKRFN